MLRIGALRRELNGGRNSAWLLWSVRSSLLVQYHRLMGVTVDVKGGETATVDDPDTYEDLLAAVELSPHEATVLVDGKPVPEDAAVDADEVVVLRLVQGG